MLRACDYTSKLIWRCWSEFSDSVNIVADLTEGRKHEMLEDLLIDNMENEAAKIEVWVSSNGETKLSSRFENWQRNYKLIPHVKFAYD